MSYITLVSGSNELEYGNTPSKFINKLPLALDFDENIEMGLCELSYTCCQNNIDYIRTGLMVYDHLYELKLADDQEPRYLYGEMFFFDVEKGYYANEHELCNVLNRMIYRKIPRLKGLEIFHYDRSIRKFLMNATDYFLTVSISQIYLCEY